MVWRRVCGMKACKLFKNFFTIHVINVKTHFYFLNVQNSCLCKNVQYIYGNIHACFQHCKICYKELFKLFELNV